MFAVIKTGGKQYRVKSGDLVQVESLAAAVGEQVTLDHVLAMGEGEHTRIGSPLLAGAVVMATVVSQGRHPKVRIFKMRRRKHFAKSAGHRQNFTELRIDSIG
jgi:large subunit ribosomal protein L21